MYSHIRTDIYISEATTGLVTFSLLDWTKIELSNRYHRNEKSTVIQLLAQKTTTWSVKNLISSNHKNEILSSTANFQTKVETLKSFKKQNISIIFFREPLFNSSALEKFIWLVKNHAAWVNRGRQKQQFSSRVSDLKRGDKLIRKRYDNRSWIETQKFEANQWKTPFSSKYNVVNFMQTNCLKINTFTYFEWKAVILRGINEMDKNKCFAILFRNFKTQKFSKIICVKIKKNK